MHNKRSKKKKKRVQIFKTDDSYQLATTSFYIPCSLLCRWGPQKELTLDPWATIYYLIMNSLLDSFGPDHSNWLCERQTHYLKA